MSRRKNFLESDVSERFSRENLDFRDDERGRNKTYIARVDMVANLLKTRLGAQRSQVSWQPDRDFVQITRWDYSRQRRVTLIEQAQDQAGRRTGRGSFFFLPPQTFSPVRRKEPPRRGVAMTDIRAGDTSALGVRVYTGRRIAISRLSYYKIDRRKSANRGRTLDRFHPLEMATLILLFFSQMEVYQSNFSVVCAAQDQAEI